MVALDDVVTERIRQEHLWGQQNHFPDIWMSILMEEVGELAREALKDRFEATPENMDEIIERMRGEAVQVAAVAVAFIECLDRNRNTERGQVVKSLTKGDLRATLGG